MIRELLSSSTRPKRVLIYCLQYIFGLHNKHVIRKALTPKEFELANKLLVDGYFLKNCKLYIYKVLQNSICINSYKDFGLSKDDARCLISCRKFLSSVDTSWPAYSIEDLDECINQLLTHKLDEYMGRFITKKLSFLVKSYGLTYHDIKMDMIFSGINAIYKSYPKFESKLHALNTAKRAIHNAGIGLIAYNTKECRSQLIKDQDGLFQHKLRDISSIGEIPYTDRKDTIDDFDSLMHLLPHIGYRGRKFIELASGRYDLEFSKFLGKDNVKYLDETKYSSYMKQIRSFLGVSNKEVSVFLEKVRARL